MKLLLPIQTSLLLACLVFACGAARDSNVPSSSRPSSESPSANLRVAPEPVPDKVQAYGYEIKNVYPHDRAAFTQGLIFKDGILWESTGQFGASSLRKVDLKTGKVLKLV